MDTQEDIFYKAFLARDPRFDGKFFVGVKTTGIYCRPICPAQPKRKNVEFFSDASAAEDAGYRPCLRCRPECAPTSPAWMGRSVTVQRALKLIADVEHFECNEDDFAEQLGVSARHLRRLFQKEIGKTPQQISNMNRLNFAKKLILETQLSMTEIAFGSGFYSIRQFNEAFKKRFHQSPSSLRMRDKGKLLDSAIQLRLAYRPPFDWNSLLSFYQSHVLEGVERVSDESYERVFRMENEEEVGSLKLSHCTKNNELLLTVSSSQTRSLFKIVRNVRQMFDLDLDPLLIERTFSSCSWMSQLSKNYSGLRLPRGWDPFETAVCAILGQLVSVKQARKLVQQIVEAYGEPVQCPLTGRKSFLFPTPQVLAKETLSAVGTAEARKKTIQEFSRCVLSQKIRLDSTQDPQSFRRSFLQIKGIGPWTAEYVSLRSLGDTDAFPATDLVLKRILDQHPELNVEQFRPWRGYVALYLWRALHLRQRAPGKRFPLSVMERR